MVCNRCITAVRTAIEEQGLHQTSVELGEVEIAEEINDEQRQELNAIFEALGFELINDKKSRWIQKIKTIIVELIYYDEVYPKMTFSEYISGKLNHDYSYLSKLFSEVQGITIEQYFIAQKIERVKELLVYDEYSLSEIAHQLNYSSVSHLSRQFKKVTGLSPTHFKQLKEKKRKPLDEV
ncbi:helix-turn-helix domain-containing protein [Salinimicrobium sp. GXAS 041]|uniref:helix-turn-helix domain-containing protein n=1 Tax=Salinimicrobium sp. GXAS 041 TaxID=3400806 RepID=UPI003C71CAB7